MRYDACLASIAVASFIAGCSSSSGTGSANAAATPTAPAQTPLPVSMSASPHGSCSQPGPEFQFADMLTQQPITPTYNNLIGNLAPNQSWFYVNNLTGQVTMPAPLAPLPAPGSAQALMASSLGLTPVSPEVPAIVSTRTIAVHDIAQLQIIPDASDPSAAPMWHGSDAEALIWQVNYVDNLYKAARQAQQLGQNPPTPNAAQATAEATFLTQVEPNIANESLGANFDDSMYANAAGNPNSGDPHSYSAVCRFLSWTTMKGSAQTYTVFLNWLRRASPTPAPAVNALAQLLVKSSAPPEVQHAVGWQPVDYSVWVAKGVRPSLYPLAIVNGGDQLVATLVQSAATTLNFTLINDEPLAPVATPSAAAAASAPTGRPTASST